MIRKILIFLAALVALLFLAALLLPLLLKGKLTALIKDEINKNIEARVDFSDISLSLFKNFPLLALSVNDLLIIGKDEFEKDTLAAVRELSVGVNLRQVISSGRIHIQTIRFQQPAIHLIVLENGKANYQILKEDTAAVEEAPSDIKIHLKKYWLEKARIHYDDRASQVRLIMDNLNHSGSGDFSADFFTLTTETKAVTDFWYEGIRYLAQVHTDLLADVDMDMKNMRFTFKQNQIRLNDLEFGIDGWLSMPDENITMDLKWEARKNDFSRFLSLVPGFFTDSFKDLKSSGTLQFGGFVKGIYSQNSSPGFGLTLKIDKGMFQYPSLPETVRNVTVELSMHNSTGIPDHTVIDLKKFHADLGPHPLDAALLIKNPVTDAVFSFWLKGSVNLASLPSMIPLEKGSELSGMFIADLKAEGQMSAIEQKKFDRIKAEGYATLNGFRLKTPQMSDELVIQECRISLRPENISLLALNLRSGNSDLRASGTIKNPAGYFFRNDLLTGNFLIESDQIDLRPFMSKQAADAPAKEPESAATMKAPDLPENIDFSLSLRANRLLYDNLTLTDVNGQVAMREKTVGLNNLAFSLLDGRIILNGLYVAKDVKSPGIRFSMDIQRMDIRQTFTYFNSVQKLAPMAGKMNGRFSASFSIQGVLDEYLQPDYPTLNGEGRLQTHSASLENFEPLVKLADALKLDQFKKATLSDANLSFKIINGRVYIPTYEQTIAGYKVRMEGSHGIDQSMDYAMGIQIPTRQLPSAATQAMSSLLEKANRAGANLSMAEVMHVQVNIGGSFAQPRIETNLKASAQQITEDLKAKAAEELERRKKELEEQARAEAERLKKEAEEKARSEAERLKKEAEEKAKMEAERLKKEAEEKARREAEKQLKDLFKRPK